MYKYFFGLLLFAGTTCEGQDEKPVTDLSGAYSMLSQSLEGDAVDTTFTERKQLKIYSGHYMMYVRLSLYDLASSSFGVGTFSIKKGKLTEHIIYSASGTIENTNSFSGTVKVSKRLQGYEQVIPEIISDEGRVRLTEDYQLLRAGLQSPLDGTWKLTNAYTINKKDTAHNNTVKYKTFYRGNFSAGSFGTKSSGEKYTIAEYGTFRLNGKNKLKETITYSTISSGNGQSHDLDISLKGTDAVTIKTTDAAGIEEVEKYIRMK
ncbi:MAG: hypothetical protein ABIO55_16590 [Ginsengibacter sp.]